jgi:hypothetical protein
VKIGLADVGRFDILIVRVIEVVRLGQRRESARAVERWSLGVFENRIERMEAFEKHLRL